MKEQENGGSTLKVLVWGAVTNCGVHDLREGSTPVDALAAAGGLSGMRGWDSNGEPCVFHGNGKLHVSRPWGWDNSPNQKVFLFDLNEEGWLEFELQNKDSLAWQANLREPDREAIRS